MHQYRLFYILFFYSILYRDRHKYVTSLKLFHYFMNECVKTILLLFNHLRSRYF
jgi:hypothetical protein